MVLRRLERPLFETNIDYRIFELSKKQQIHLLDIYLDIKVGSDTYIPLEQDSIDVIESLGGEYIGTYKMLMTRMIGIDSVL